MNNIIKTIKNFIERIEAVKKLVNADEYFLGVSNLHDQLDNVICYDYFHNTNRNLFLKLKFLCSFILIFSRKYILIKRNSLVFQFCQVSERRNANLLRTQADQLSDRLAAVFTAEHR